MGLIVADDNSLGFRWERRGDVFYSDRKGPVDGEVGFYLSDFFGAAGLLAAYCRPPVGISRSAYLPLLLFAFYPRLLM